MAWAPSYAATSQMRDFARIGDGADDAQLDLAVAAASRAVDTTCNRQFGKVDVSEQRVYTPVWDRRRARWVIEIDDLQTAVGLTVAVTGGALTSYTLEPRNATAQGRPWTLLVVDPASSVKPAGTEYEAAITASWGWTSVPTAIVQATLLQANRIFARRTSPYGVAGSPDAGSELRLLARLDPDVAVAVNSYRRWWAAA